MSQENVEIIRRGYGHFMATGEVRARADLVWDVSRLGWPDQQSYPGVDGAMQFMAEWADAWDGLELEVEDYLDAGECVVVILNQRGRSKATGIRVDMRFAQVWTLRDGQAMDADVREPRGGPRSRAVGVAHVAGDVSEPISARWPPPPYWTGSGSRYSGARRARRPLPAHAPRRVPRTSLDDCAIREVDGNDASPSAFSAFRCASPGRAPPACCRCRL